MTFLTIPDNYAPVDGRLFYQFETGGESLDLDIKVIDLLANHVIGSKRIYDSAYGEIDIAPILRKMFAYSLVDSETGTSTSYGLSKRVCVEVNGERSDVRIFMAVDIADSSSPCVLGLDDGTQRQIAFGESEQIFFFAPDGGTVEVTAAGGGVSDRRSYESQPDESLQIFYIRPSDFPPQTESINVVFMLPGKVASIEYRLVRRPSSARRMSWVDTKGIMRFHTFPTCSPKTVRFDRERIYGPSGYVDIDVRTETLLRLVSDFEPRARVEKLVGILSSRFIWLRDAGEWVRMCAVSAETAIACDGSLNRAEIEVKPVSRDVRL